MKPSPVILKIFAYFALLDLYYFVPSAIVAGQSISVKRLCDPPKLRNGRERLRLKSVRFRCNPTFFLIGNGIAECSNGKWNSAVPICTKPGCPIPAAPEHGIITPEHSNSVVRIYCLPNYAVSGQSIVYCNGTEWDRPLGNCRETDTIMPLGCDFETSDLCGWTNDATHDFAWSRSSGTTAVRRLRTGPMHDHTTMQANHGHFMLIETAAQQMSDRARLMSPVYLAEKSQNACFRFWYYMYGAAVNTLQVYVKPVSISIDTMVDNAKYMIFQKSGNQGNQWLEGFVNFDEINENFQLAFEAVSGVGHLGDIAIDDVMLINGTECATLTMEAPVAADGDPSGIDTKLIYDKQSCFKRCNETESVSNKTTTLLTLLGIIESCDCHVACEELNTCCFDYAKVCTFDSPDDEVEPVPDTAKPSTPTTTTTTRSTTTTTTLRTTPTTTTTTTTTTPRSTTTATTPKTTPTTTKTTTTTRRATTSTTVAKPRTTPSTTTTRTTSTTTTTSTTPRTISSTTTSQKTTKVVALDGAVVRTTSVGPIHAEGKVWTPTKIEHDTNAISPILLLVLALAITIVVTISMAAFCQYYRRTHGPENYKKNAKQGVEVNGSVEEFSEVRYLTSDEILDFTMATVPSNESSASVKKDESVASASNTNSKDVKKTKKTKSYGNNRRTRRPDVEFDGLLDSGDEIS